jgi:uncharacterized protein YkwD
VRPRHLALVVVLALTCGTYTPVYADEALNRTIDQVLKHVNLQRAMNGERPLTLDRRLTDAAQKHAEDMARRDFIDHQSPDGRGLQDRTASTGYPWRAIAENLAAGLSSPRSTVESWMTSPGHRDNMLSREYQEAGVGYATPAPGGKRPRYSHYWVVVFGAKSR